MRWRVWTFLDHCKHLGKPGQSQGCCSEEEAKNTSPYPADTGRIERKQWRCVCLVVQLCLTLCDRRDCSPPGSSIHRDSPGKSTGVGCHALLQGIFPTQGLNPGLPHCRWILYHLSHQGGDDKLHSVISKELLDKHGYAILSICFWQVILCADIIGSNSILIAMESRTVNSFVSLFIFLHINIGLLKVFIFSF